MSDEYTCGYGLADHAPLHARLASLLAAVGLNLELHLGSLDPGDETSAPEHAAYTELVERHRDVADRLASLARRMESFRTLPMASHDMDALTTPAVGAAYERLLWEREHLFLLLRDWIEGEEASASGDESRTAQG